MIRSRKHVAALLAMNAALLFAGAAQAGNWQSNAPFGATLQGDLYTPTTVAANPAILVAIHYCSGNAAAVHTWFQQYADQYGFYIIAPNAGKNCFDASASRSGDPAAIVTMVNWVLTNKHADKTRVFAAGMSSGGCMTNTLLAIYPDVFAGGSAMPGLPAGGWPAGDTSCSVCGEGPTGGPSTSDPKTWGDKARAAFQWSGTYPCSQQWAGGGDKYGFENWLPAVVGQWQNLAGLDAGATATTTWSGWKRMVYKDSAGNVRLETNLGPSSQQHDIQTVSPPVYPDVIRFLSLDTPNGICGIVPSGSGGMGSGGASSGGAPGAGGAMGTAGAPHMGGAPGTGGATGTGGGSMGTGGGSMGTGGSTGRGGTTSTGGSSTGSGGTSTTTGGTGTATGGTTSTGGTGTATGGTTSSGGSTSASGGAPSGTTGGTTASGASSGSTSTPPSTGSGGDDGGDKGGCSLSIGEHSEYGPIAALLIAGLAFFTRRRRARG